MKERRNGVMVGGKQPLDMCADLSGCGRTPRESKATVSLESFVLQTPSLPFPGDVSQMMVVEDVRAVLPTYVRQGFSIAVEPHKSSRGTYTVLQDHRGTRIGLIEQRGTVLSTRQ